MSSSALLHKHPEFKSLIEITAGSLKIDEPSLVEKDYWIMHCLHGLQTLGFTFQLKGGTSLSKGFGVIDRFSEDIDLRVEPDPKVLGFEVRTGKNHDKQKDRDARKEFFAWAQERLTGKIDGITETTVDPLFSDQPKYRNCGLRLKYPSLFAPNTDLKEGVLLELGFANTAPNEARTISSWAYDYALAKKVSVTDNRAPSVLCYDYKYTFIEKLQTIAHKYGQYVETKKLEPNFLRHYYDVYQLLQLADVQKFIGTKEYSDYKAIHFRPKDDVRSGAFKLETKGEREMFEKEYQSKKTLYFKGQPKLAEILTLVNKHIEKM